MTGRILRTLVLADEANVAQSLASLDRKTDWGKLRNYVANPKEGREIIEFVIYVGMPPDTEDAAYQDRRAGKTKFLTWARHNGFMVVQKDGMPIREPDGRLDGRFKANVDVTLAIDAMDLAIEMRPDVVVILSGDADFAHLAMALRRRGIRVEVCATDQAMGAQLKAAANGVISLNRLINELEPLRAGAQRMGGQDVFDDVL